MDAKSLYKKSGLVTAYLARDLLTRSVGDQCPTISDCTREYNVSRGTVQSALSTLETEGCIRTVKKGQKGTILCEIDKGKLYSFICLDHLTASMPLPLNMPLGSLATAVLSVMDQCPIPFTFAFQQGAEHRIQALNRGTFDFIVASQMTAKNFLAQYPNLEITLTLKDCLYSQEYNLCINRPDATGLTDGMVLATDPACSDQSTLLRQVIQGRNIKIVHLPYNNCCEAFVQGTVDAIIFRRGDWLSKLNHVTTLPILDPNNPVELMKTPVIISNKTNRGMTKLLQYFIDPKAVGQIQQEILAGTRKSLFYWAVQ